MVVDLTPVEELAIDEDVLAFVNEAYCANCTHCSTGSDQPPYCTYWDEETEIRSGWVCPEYRPQGYGE